MKLSLDILKDQTGVGECVEKTIYFANKSGETVSGQVFIKILSRDEVVNAPKIYANKKELTIDQHVKALVYASAYSDENTRLFAKIEETGKIPNHVLEAIYNASDEVNNFKGKPLKLKQKTNSSASLSSMESVDEPLKKQEEI